MAENSAIEWTDHTFNPWTGCTKVSPGCEHCYAEALSKRSPKTFGSWAPGAERKRTSAAYWSQPLRWDNAARRAGRRARVFCASMADVFDNQVPPEWRAQLWHLIARTDHLDWLLLTKRPQNIAGMLPPGWGNGWPNVWLGTTAENQAEADRRIPHLLAAPARIRFLSCEPLLGPIDLRYLQPGDPPVEIDALASTHGVLRPHQGRNARVDWVIVGGESGSGARPMDPAWARSLRDQCAAAGVPLFMKQMGGPVKARMPAIPEDLLIREFPR
jgi:protein gp37